MRPGVVVAGDEAPELPAVDQRDRHRRDHAHVGQVLQVHRRDAAQHGAGEVERPAGGRLQRHRRVGRVRDDPHPVGRVQRAGLRRDVAGRVAQAEERLEVGTAVLGDHLAVPLRVEAVDHHPVVAGDRPDVARQDGGELVERAGGREPLQDDGQPAVPGRARLLGARDRLPLGDQQPVGAVQHEVDVAAAHLHAQRVDLGQVAGEARPQLREVVVVQELVEGGAGHRPAEELGGVRRGDDDGEVGSVTASSTPCGWIAPGMAIGSSAQRSSAARSVGGRLRARSPPRRYVPAPARRCRRGSRPPTRRGARARRGRAGRRSAGPGRLDRGATTCSVDAGGGGRAGDAHELAGAGGVEERRGRQIDDQRARGGGDPAVDRCAEPRRGREVQLTPYGEGRAPGNRRPFHCGTARIGSLVTSFRRPEGMAPDSEEVRQP